MINPLAKKWSHRKTTRKSTSRNSFISTHPPEVHPRIPVRVKDTPTKERPEQGRPTRKWSRGNLVERRASAHARVYVYAHALQSPVRALYLPLPGRCPSQFTFANFTGRPDNYRLSFQPPTVTSCNDWLERASIVWRRKSVRTWGSGSKAAAVFSRNCSGTILARSWMCPLGAWKSSSSLAFISPNSLKHN